MQEQNRTGPKCAKKTRKIVLKMAQFFLRKTSKKPRKMLKKKTCYVINIQRNTKKKMQLKAEEKNVKK